MEKFNESERLFSRLNYKPFYNDFSDYNTNAKSYYDYLSKYNKFLSDLVAYINDMASKIDGLEELQDLTNLKKDMEKIKNDIIKIDNPLDRLNYQKVLGNVDVRGKDGISFVQGMTIINERDELYVVRKNNDLTTNVITRYKLSTFEEIDYRVVTLNSKAAYNEGLPYFINTNDEICFILRSSYDHNACIFNYNKSEKSADFILPGGSKTCIDSNKKYFISNYGDASELLGLYVYDYDSVINKEPKLIKMIRFKQSVINDEKVQSIAIVNNHIVLTQGKTQPKITVCTMNGDVVNTTSLNKYSVRDMILKQYPNAKLKYTSIDYEAEGSDVFVDENGKEYLTLMHVFPQSEKVFITRVGDIDGYKIKISENTDNIIIPNWKPVNDYGENVTPFSSYEWEQPHFMIDDNGFINLRGICTYPARDTTQEWSEMNKVLFTLPYPYVTYTNQFFKTVAGGNPEKTNRIMVRFNKDKQKTEVILVSTSDNSSKPFCALDGIRFFHETRYERWYLENK